MNTVGKSLALTLLTFAAAILGITLTLMLRRGPDGRNYKDQAAYWSYKYHQALRENTKVERAWTASIEAKKADYDSKTKEGKALADDLTDKNKRLDQARRENNQVYSEKEDAVAKFNSSRHMNLAAISQHEHVSSQILAQRESIDNSGALLKEAEQAYNDNLNRVNATTQERNETTAYLARLNDDNKKLQYVLGELKKHPEIKELVADAEKKALGPTIAGRIASVNERTGIAVLTVGSADGVRLHMQFGVHRGDRFIGQVVVTDVISEKMCAVRIILDGKRDEILSGDEASYDL
jgi:septal ring factor EnvC (AmiA/AmiB activator)